MSSMKYDLHLGVNSTETFITKIEAPSFVEYGIVMAGITHINDEYYLARQNSKFHILLYTVSGEGVLNVQTNISSNQHILKSDELLALPSGQSYNYQPQGNNWHFLWFIINPTPQWDFLKEVTVQ